MPHVQVHDTLLHHSLFRNVSGTSDARDAWESELRGGTLQMMGQQKYRMTWPRNKSAWPIKHFPVEAYGPFGPKCEHLESHGQYRQKKRACSPSTLWRAPCLIISIGSNNQWGFEEAVVAHTPCNVATLDCTLNLTTTPLATLVPESLRSRVTFHHRCIRPSRQYDDINATYVGMIHRDMRGNWMGGGTRQRPASAPFWWHPYLHTRFWPAPGPSWEWRELLANTGLLSHVWDSGGASTKPTATRLAYLKIDCEGCVNAC